jgi:3-oxo-5-alpha-steroid 4-dehydrogenase 1
MTEHDFFTWLLVAAFGLAAAVFVLLFFIAAPYGRHARRGWGPSLGSRLAWVIMEAPSPVLFGLYFLTGTNPVTVTSVVFLVMWEGHYIHRAFLYPFSLRGAAHRMPVVVVGMGIIFNLMNAYLNGRWLFHFSPGYGNAWLHDPRFIGGVALFVIGYFINRQADLALRSLRREGESGYQISNGFLHRLISSPNYLGEIVIWTGWAIATWSLPGLAFAVWTVANLAPRARTNHRWYQETFPEYPPERKALLPGIW